MISAREFINKIKWDKLLKSDQYCIYYFDNKLKREVEIPFSKIKEISKNFIVVESNSNNLNEINIPLHTVREIRKNGKLVWKRIIKN